MSSAEDELLTGHPVVRTGDPGRAIEAMERVLPRIPMRLRSVEGGRLRMVMNAAEVGCVTACYMRFGADVHMVTGETEAYYVNIPRHGRTLWRSETTQVSSSPTVAAVLSPGVRGEVVWEADCAQLCVMLGSERVHRELERRLDRAVDEPLRFDLAMDLTTPTALGWLATLRLVHGEIERPGGLLSNPLALRTFENVLVDTLLLAQPHTYTAQLTAPAKRVSPGAVKAAIELLESHPERAWSVGELSREVHLSTRALQQAFAGSVGLSPMRYLRQVRLARVHDELVGSLPDQTSVGEVAARWGFLHHGHFAATYRARYGRTPAHTLRTGD